MNYLSHLRLLFASMSTEIDLPCVDLATNLDNQFKSYKSTGKYLHLIYGTKEPLKINIKSFFTLHSDLSYLTSEEKNNAKLQLGVNRLTIMTVSHDDCLFVNSTPNFEHLKNLAAENYGEKALKFSENSIPQKVKSLITRMTDLFLNPKYLG